MLLQSLGRARLARHVSVVCHSSTRVSSTSLQRLVRFLFALTNRVCKSFRAPECKAVKRIAYARKHPRIYLENINAFRRRDCASCFADECCLFSSLSHCSWLVRFLPCNQSSRRLPFRISVSQTAIELEKGRLSSHGCFSC